MSEPTIAVAEGPAGQLGALFQRVYHACGEGANPTCQENLTDGAVEPIVRSLSIAYCQAAAKAAAPLLSAYDYNGGAFSSHRFETGSGLSMTFLPDQGVAQGCVDLGGDSERAIWVVRGNPPLHPPTSGLPRSAFSKDCYTGASQGNGASVGTELVCSAGPWQFAVVVTGHADPEAATIKATAESMIRGLQG